MNAFLQQNRLKYIKTFTFQYCDDCALLGITPEGFLYVEEFYGTEGWIAQYKLKLDGEFMTSVDEKSGTVIINALSLPDDLVAPCPIKHSVALNFTGARHRGLRESDRIQEIVQPLAIAEKMTLINVLGLNMMPPLLLGVAESTVLAEAPFDTDGHYLVCRRVRLAYALPQQKLDTDGLPYDYDTLTISLIHPYDPHNDLSLRDTLAMSKTLLDGVNLQRPIDCMIHENLVMIADGGDGKTRQSAVHLFEKIKT